MSPSNKSRWIAAILLLGAAAAGAAVAWLTEGTGSEAAPARATTPVEQPTLQVPVPPPAAPVPPGAPSKEAQQVFEPMARDELAHVLVGPLARMHDFNRTKRAGEVPGADLRALSEAFAKEFQIRSPAEGIRLAGAALESLPRLGAPMERIALLHAAGHYLDTNPKLEVIVALREFMRSEMTTTVVPARRPRPDGPKDREPDDGFSTTADLAVPQIAFDYYLGTSPPAAEAVLAAVRAMTVQGDWVVTDAMARALVRRYPGEKERLIASLSSRGFNAKAISWDASPEDGGEQ